MRSKSLTLEESMTRTVACYDAKGMNTKLLQEFVARMRMYVLSNQLEGVVRGKT